MSVRSAIASAAVITLVSCAGGGSVVPSQHEASVAAPLVKRALPVTIRIKVPRRKHRHRAQFISPATASMTLKIARGSKMVINKTIAVTPGSPGCSTAPSGTICVSSVLLAPGSYAATILTYDGPNGTGNLLSTAQGVAFTVAAGRNNTIPLTLSGVPASIAVLPADIMSTLDPGSGIDVAGQGVHRLFAQALDADGNVIVGAGAPTFSVTNTGSYTGYTLGQPDSKSGNAFTVTPPTKFTFLTASVKVQAAYAPSETNGCAQLGAVCSATVTVYMRDLLAAPYTYSYPSNDIGLFYAGANVPVAQIQLNPTSDEPSWATFVNGADVAVHDGTSGGIFIFTPPYDKPPIATINFVPSLPGLGGKNGALIVADGPAIEAYPPPYTSHSVLGFAADVQLMTLDPSGNLFVVLASGFIAEVPPPYTAVGTGVTSVGSGQTISAMAVDANENVYFYDSTSGDLEEEAAPYGASPSSVSTGSDAVGSLATDPSLNLYVGWCDGCGGFSFTSQISQYSSFPSSWPGSPSTTFGADEPLQLIEDGSGLYVDQFGYSLFLQFPAIVQYNGQFPNSSTSAVTSPWAYSGGFIPMGTSP
ncbi:MAG: hypothetical protein JO092_12045 [Candidatus Eremiobacteraeota bacterium]|nr:hypothetical protein [Candidatus Eremiobacteraeota bacterium]